MARDGETEGEGEICACKRWDATCGRRHKGKSARIGGRCRAIASIEAWRERQRRNLRKESGGWRVGSIGPVGPLDLALTDGYLFFSLLFGFLLSLFASFSFLYPELGTRARRWLRFALCLALLWSLWTFGLSYGEHTVRHKEAEKQ